ncbi:OTU-like cysteine protease domain-containing protein [Cyclospora cayetanensis]|uniref:OTU-like cysteine protease domain-containing protein n=1 Tax=Cyclospora cayetanensis TaxID=88456 RepID=A0A1D3D1V2_9EIME|nr:OTU-like cysteine protease domain-containing protein [Cyclospora cayetanensis]
MSSTGESQAPVAAENTEPADTVLVAVVLPELFFSTPKARQKGDRLPLASQQQRASASRTLKLRVASATPSKQEEVLVKEVQQQFNEALVAASRSDNSSVWRERLCRRAVSAAASLLRGAAIRQFHELSILARLRFTSVAVFKTIRRTGKRIRHGRRLDGEKESEKEAEKDNFERCVADPMAEGCTAKELAAMPLKLDFARKGASPTGLLFSDVLAEWQDSVALEALFLFTFEQRKYFDLTGAFVNVQVFLQTTAHYTVVLSVPSDMPLSAFIASLLSISMADAAEKGYRVGDGGRLVAADGGSGAGAQGADGGPGGVALATSDDPDATDKHEEGGTGDRGEPPGAVDIKGLAKSLEVFSVEGEKLPGEMKMNQASPKGIVIQVSSSFPARDALLSLHQTRIFCFSCRGPQEPATEGPSVEEPLERGALVRGTSKEPTIIASLTVNVCSDSEELEANLFTAPSDLTSSEDGKEEGTELPKCKMARVIVPGIPEDTSELSLRAYLLYVAGLAPSAQRAFLLCHAAEDSLCIPRDRNEVVEGAPEAEGGSTKERDALSIVRRLLLAEVEGEKVFFFKRPAVPLPVSSLSPLLYKHHFFYNVRLPDRYSSGSVCASRVRVQLETVGSTTEEENVLFLEEVDDELLQEELIYRFVWQRMHAPFLDPAKDLRLCYIPRTALFAATADAKIRTGRTINVSTTDCEENDSCASKAATITSETDPSACISLPPGSAVRDVIQEVEHTEAQLFLLPVDTGEILEKGEPPRKVEFSECRVIVFPQNLVLDQSTISVTLALPSGGLFFIVGIPFSVVARELLLLIISSIEQAEEVLVKFPTGMTAQSLFLVFAEGGSEIPEETPVWRLRCFKECGAFGQRSGHSIMSETDMKLCNSCKGWSTPVMLQFKYRPLDSPKFRLRMQPLKDRVLEYSTSRFSPRIGVKKDISSNTIEQLPRSSSINFLEGGEMGGDRKQLQSSVDRPQPSFVHNNQRVDTAAAVRKEDQEGNQDSEVNDNEVRPSVASEDLEEFDCPSRTHRRRRAIRRRLKTGPNSMTEAEKEVYKQLLEKHEEAEQLAYLEDDLPSEGPHQEPWEPALVRACLILPFMNSDSFAQVFSG